MFLTIRRSSLVNKPLISVIIPTYNRVSCLTKSINSVLNQTYKNLELIVVDDGSTDDTKNVISSIKDFRLKYIKLNKNYGPSRARNVGIKKATGLLVTFNDSDDIWHYDKLEKQYEDFVNNPDGVLFFCKYEAKDVITGKKLYEIPDEHHILDFSKTSDFTEVLLKGNFIGTPTILVPKIVIEKLEGFDEKLSTHEDWDFVIRASLLGEVCYYDEPLVDVYPSNNGINQVNTLDKILSLFRIVNKYWEKYNKKNIFNGFFDVINKYLSENNISILEDMTVSFIKDDSNQCYFQILMYVYFRKLMEYNNIINDYKTHVRNIEAINKSLKENVERQQRDNKSLSVKYDKMISFEKYKKNLIEMIVQLYCEDKLRAKLFPKFAVYGVGDVGLSLISLSLKAGIKIPFTIDKRNKTFENIPCYSIAEIPKTDIPIIITAFDPSRSIKDDIKNYTSATIYYLEDLLKK